MSPVTSPDRPASSIEACVAKSDIVCKTVDAGTTFLKKEVDCIKCKSCV